MKKVAVFLSIIYISLIYFIDELNNFSHVTTFTLLIPIIFCMINPLLNLIRIKNKVIKNKFYYIILNIVLLINIGILLNNVYFIFNNPTIAYLHYFDNLLFTTPLFLLPFIMSIFVPKEMVIKKDKSIFILLIISVLSLISLGDRAIGIGFLINVISTIAPIILISQLLTTTMTRTELQKYYFILALLAILGANPFTFLLYIILYMNLDYSAKNM